MLVPIIYRDRPLRRRVSVIDAISVLVSIHVLAIRLVVVMISPRAARRLPIDARRIASEGRRCCRCCRGGGCCGLLGLGIATENLKNDFHVMALTATTDATMDVIP